MLSKSGLTLKHRTYTINQSDEDFFGIKRGKQSVKKGVWYIGDKKKKEEKTKRSCDSVWINCFTSSFSIR